jgi:toxin secretion/phage lysis holin
MGFSMNNTFAAIKYGLTVAGGFVAYWLGGVDKLLTALIAFMVLDYATGLLGAWSSHTISSAVGFRGIAKKVMLLGVVAVAFIIEDVTGGNLPLRELTIMFFIANEGLSILENAATAGLPLPTKLKDALLQVRKGSEDAKADSANQ